MRRKISILIFVFSVLAFIFTPSNVFANEADVPLTPRNGIPLVIVYVNETQADIDAANAGDQKHQYGNIQNMNESGDHSVRALGDVEIIVPDGYAGVYGSSAVPQGRMKLKYIRGRGNSTWTEDKKPYKVQFEEVQDLFGMGACKEWALMAHAMDDTLMRNRITLWLGDRIGLAYTPQMVPVDFVMVGLKKDADGVEQEVSRDYLGSYCLAENVEIDPSRVGIDSLKKKDTEEPAVTGGYLLAIYNEFQDSNKVPQESWFTTPSGLRLTNKDPEFTETNLADREKQRDYIRNYISKLDGLIMESEEITPEIHSQIDQMLDLKSVADYWWVQEFSYNTDAYETGSTYMYKVRDGKLYFGPLWDFDLAWSVGIDTESGYAQGFNNTKLDWIDALREKDPQFSELLKERWNAEDGVRKALLEITDNSKAGIMNRYWDEVAASRAAEMDRWPVIYPDEEKRDYNACVERLRNWITKRLAWIDDNLELMVKVQFTLTYLTDDGKVFATDKSRGGDMLGTGPDGPQKKDYVFIGWKDKDTGISHEECRITGDISFVPVYKKASEAIVPTGIYLRTYEEWVPFDLADGQEDFYPLDDPAVVPQDADGRLTWTSSDESILYFDKFKTPMIRRRGEVDLTVSTWNGLSKTLHLHIYDPNQEGMEVTVPESFHIEPADCTIKKGETKELAIKILPEGRPVETLYYEFEPDDYSIIDFHPCCGNVITGLKAGKVKVKVTASTSDTNEEDAVKLTSSFTVTVTDDKKPAVKKTSINKAKVLLSKKAFTYNGKVQRPAIKKVGGKTLTAGKDYSLKWSKASSKKIGIYSVTVIGKGSYSGKTKAIYKILPKGTKIKKLKKKGKSVLVRWKKQAKKMPSSRITGYQLQFATDKKFTKNKKTVKIKGFKRVKKRVKGLKKNKTYYVRIRTYKMIRGKRYASKWSQIRKVKTK